MGNSTDKLTVEIRGRGQSYHSAVKEDMQAQQKKYDRELHLPCQSSLLSGKFVL